ncbi:aggregation promoting factor surface protein [Lentilactobacillus parafarraginis]|jgi:hypothetical protein|uniref:Aggregation promoting factor-like surface protein n=3 Tax=Lentilactobacillus parafarraginis TaxID=390842 RepID=A0A0R1YJL6_9LACO|nr:hypothetical protein [Lentilactobacillus parafarraginis]EHL99746.1 hypothetical protein HMPREF9103_00867 [Lentilactobacillus parafarraginis F0439]KRM42445.1 hypothetical protein FD47_GL001865 [Lentilactobacillus parafarraginis DSM 18390 = JCM 14109]TLQ20355.1 aggregation promoting factor surface protein [Lentilactobacillus parafarraginis]
MSLKKAIIAIMTTLTLFGAFQAATTEETANAQTTSVTKTYKSNLSKANLAAKKWIAFHESRGSYTARNGRYVGRYQLSSSYLHGDYSKANQEKTADRYVKARYGSWVNAKKHWRAYGWY